MRLVALLLAVAAGGCGGQPERTGTAGGRRTSRASAAELEQAKRQRAEREAQDKAAADAARRAPLKVAARTAPPPPPPPSTATVASPAPVAPPKPVRPESLDDWRMADYLGARAEGDPRLLEAVKHLGTLRAHDPAAAQILVTLLARAEQLPASGTAAPRNPALVRALVGALHANGSGPARACLEQLLSGQFPTDDDALAQSLAVDLLSARPTADSEGLLLNAVLQPHAWTAHGRPGALPISGPRLLAALKTSASDDARVKLVQSASHASAPKPLKLAVQQFVLVANPANLAAQTALYRSPKLSPQARQTLEGHFAAYGAETLRRLYGAALPPAEKSPPSARPLPSADVDEALAADAALPQRVAEHLWNDRLLARVNEELLALDRLDEARQGLLALGATVPRDGTRAALCGALRHTWHDGPEALRAAGIGTQSFCDPGLLFSLKSLSRKTPAAAPRKSASRPASLAQRNLKLSEEQAARLNAQWQQYAFEVLRATAARMESASARVRLAGGEQTAEDGDDDSRRTVAADAARNGLPLDLHPDARIVARYDRSWPRDGDLQARLPADATEMHYVRIQQTTNRLRAIVSHYRHELGSAGEVLLTSRGVALPGAAEKAQGLWLQGRPRATADGRKRVVDVVIMRPNAGPPPPADVAERLTIDILTLEMADPAGGES